jgi:hypothetical protein
MALMPRPASVFRWDLKRRESIGRLARPDPAWLLDFLPPDGSRAGVTLQTYLDALETLCVRLLAASGDGQIYFVGRSPENLFDYLSGILTQDARRDRLCLLPLSLFGIRTLTARDTALLRTHFTQHALTPAEISTRPHPTVFCDLVHEGGTFERIARFLKMWGESEGLAWHAFRRKLRFVGIVKRRKTSPNTFRWHQPLVKDGLLAPSNAHNISLDGVLWSMLGDQMVKTTLSFRSNSWTDPDVAKPRHDAQTLAALACALYLYDRGASRAAQTAFAAHMGRSRGMLEAWFRELRGVIAA